MTHPRSEARWYQTSVARVYTIATMSCYLLGLCLLALVAAFPAFTSKGDLAFAVLLLLFDVNRRLYRLERRP